MTKNRLHAPNDEPVSWSSWLALLALLLALVGLLLSGYNGLLLLSAVAAILSIARRVIESHRRSSGTHERNHP